MEGGSWEGECVKATTCEIILSRCTCTYNHNWKSRKSHYIWQEILLNMWAHLCVAYIAFYVHVFACACVCISQHACVFSFGSIAAPDLLLLEDDYYPESFPVDSGKVVTHGNCWVTPPPAARADKLTNHEAMQAFTISYLSLGGCVIIPKLIMHVGLLHSKPSSHHMLW